MADAEQIIYALNAIVENGGKQEGSYGHFFTVFEHFTIQNVSKSHFIWPHVFAVLQK